MPIERYFLANWKALGAVEVMEEIPMKSAFLSSSQSGSAISSIKAFER
jgi:hypothetical protein